jgi:hypothetical protein
MKCKSTRRYVSRLSSIVLGTNKVCLGARIREKRKRKGLGWSSQDSVRSGTLDCPVRQDSFSELATLEKTSAAYGYNSPDCPVVHRTVR